MSFAEKYDRTITGFAAGALLPVMIGLGVYLFTSDGLSISAYFSRISETNIITHTISLCVFPNVAIFLLFNRFDMLKACRGVLAVTIIWAAAVFIIKFFG